MNSQEGKVLSDKKGFSLPFFCSIINGRQENGNFPEEYKENQEEYHVRFKVCQRKS